MSGDSVLMGFMAHKLFESWKSVLLRGSSVRAPIYPFPLRGAQQGDAWRARDGAGAPGDDAKGLPVEPTARARRRRPVANLGREPFLQVDAVPARLASLRAFI